LKDIEEKKFKTGFMVTSNLTYSSLKATLKEAITEIENNNLLTLIGSLVTTDHYQNIAYIQNTCSYNGENPKNYNSFKLNDNRSIVEIDHLFE
jgi:hypothetical protein